MGPTKVSQTRFSTQMKRDKQLISNTEATILLPHCGQHMLDRTRRLHKLKKACYWHNFGMNRRMIAPASHRLSPVNW